MAIMIAILMSIRGCIQFSRRVFTRCELTVRVRSLYTQRMQKAPPLESVFRSLKSLVQNNMPTRPWDWQSTLLVVALVQIAAARLIISEWVPNLFTLQTISLCAVVFGLLLGYSNFTGKISLWIAAEYALVIIPLRLLGAVDEAERTEFL